MLCTPVLRKAVYALLPLTLSSCGGNSAGGYLGAAGGELCLPDRRVCISVPLNGLPDDKFISIRPSNDVPGGALSDSWSIGPDGTLFLKEATVTFRYDGLDGAIDLL